MARTSKSTRLGNYIDREGEFDIRQLFSYTKIEKNGKSRVSGHDIRVCNGKNLIKSGFKTKDQAIEYIKGSK